MEGEGGELSKRTTCFEGEGEMGVGFEGPAAAVGGEVGLVGGREGVGEPEGSVAPEGAARDAGTGVLAPLMLRVGAAKILEARPQLLRR